MQGRNALFLNIRYDHLSLLCLLDLLLISTVVIGLFG